MKTPIVELLRDDGVRVKFLFPRAEALLRGERKMKHGVWKLPEDSQYEFKHNGLIRRQNKRNTARKAECGTTGQSTKARKPADNALSVDTE